MKTENPCSVCVNVKTAETLHNYDKIESIFDTLFFMEKKTSQEGKTHKKCLRYFIMYGDLYISHGMTGISYKIKKNVKKNAKKR